MNTKRELYKNIANETLDIINKGYYINTKKQMINISDDVQRSIDKTRLYELNDALEYSKNN